MNNSARRMLEITQLQDIIKLCSIDGNGIASKLVRMCMYEEALIRNDNNKPIYLTEFQRGYLYALSLTSNEYGLSHGICKLCSQILKSDKNYPGPGV